MSRRNLKVQFFNDFTGGLNNNEQRQNLALNETPDCQDVVFNNRGGFRTRRGYETVVNNSILDGAYIGGSFSAGTEVLWGIDDTGGLWTYDGTTFTDVTTTNPVDSGVVVKSAVWDDKLYFASWLSSSTYYMRYWNGSAFTTLTNTANNDYTAPTGGNAPLARLIANHSGHMFWADTTESGTRYRSRLRFSHPLQPEDFAANDYFDIEPADQTDQITALVPFRNMMLVFKRKGVYGLYGYDRETFIVQRLSTQAGVSCQEAVATNAGIAYWWSVDGNVYAFNGSGIVPVGDRIKGIVDEGIVVTGCLTNRVDWVDNQLFVSLRKTGGDRVMFVFDPSVGERGAWTRFSFAPTSMFWWQRSAAESKIMFTLPGFEYLFDMSNPDKEGDTYGGVDYIIPAYYKMPWYSALDTGLGKRWSRPTITAASTSTGTMIVEVYHNFNEAIIDRTLLLNIDGTESGQMYWGDNWGTEWNSGGSDLVYEFERLPSLGRANAVQLRFRMTGNKGAWWIDSVAIPYLEKAYR